MHRFSGKRWDAVTGTYDLGFRDYDPGLNRFLTRDMFNGALADMFLTTNPWTLGRYTFGGGNPISRVEDDGHLPIPKFTGGGSSVPAPTCTESTPEYCHAPGENTTGPWGLGLQWLAFELDGLFNCSGGLCGLGGPGRPAHTEYFREGDPFTEGIRTHQHIQDVRVEIAAELAAGETHGELPLHYGDRQYSPDDRGTSSGPTSIPCSPSVTLVCRSSRPSQDRMTSAGRS